MIKPIVVEVVRITTIPTGIRITPVVAIVVIVVVLSISLSLSLVHMTVVVEAVHVRHVGHLILPVSTVKSRHPSISLRFSLRFSFSLVHMMVVVEVVHVRHVGHLILPVSIVKSRHVRSVWHHTRLPVGVEPLGLGHRKDKEGSKYLKYNFLIT